MRFLLAVYVDEKSMAKLSHSENVELDRISLEYDAELKKSGHFLASSALKPVHTAKTVRIRGGNTSVTDGPFAETKEVLGGFILIEARDMEEAVALAKKVPVARYGSIEVRPEMKIGPEREW
jgi:hypothetical protein